MEVVSVAPKTIHVVGDSHALAFKRKNLVIKELGQVFSASVCYVRGIRPDTLVQNGALNPDIGQYLVRQGILAPDGQVLALSKQHGAIMEQYATGVGFQKETVLIHIGEIYVRKYLAALNESKQFDSDVITSDLRKVVEPYVLSAVAIKKSMHLFVVLHEICPPTADDVRFERINKFLAPRELRSLVYRIFNELLNEYSTKHKIVVCPSNDCLADEAGLLRAEFEFDGVHADPKYSAMSLGRVALNWLSRSSSARSPRYEKWAEISGQMGNPQPISTIGVTEPVQALNQTQVERLTDSVGNFDYLVSKQPPNDWAHAPPTTEHEKFQKVIRYGVVAEEGLQILYDVFIKGPIGDSIRAQIGSRFAIINARAVESAPHDNDGLAQQSFHRDDCPAGIYRGLLYLVDVDENDGPFEYMPVDGAPEPTRVVGKAGSFILFDADAVKHRASPPRVRQRLAIDFVILAIPEAADELVNSADVGLIWPLDPYMFILSERCYPPVNSGRWFYPSLVTAEATDN